MNSIEITLLFCLVPTVPIVCIYCKRMKLVMHLKFYICNAIYTYYMETVIGSDKQHPCSAQNTKAGTQNLCLVLYFIFIFFIFICLTKMSRQEPI